MEFLYLIFFHQVNLFVATLSRNGEVFFRLVDFIIMSIEYNTFFSGPGESVFANLCQYHLESCYVDMLVSDSAHTVWREGELFDAIITDRKIYNWTVTNTIGRQFFIIQIF